MELVNCKKCELPPAPQLFYGKTYIRCEMCKKSTQDHKDATQAFIEWNNMNK